MLIQLFLIDSVHDFFEGERGLGSGGHGLITKAMEIGSSDFRSGQKETRSPWDLLNQLYKSSVINGDKYLNLSKNTRNNPQYMKTIAGMLISPKSVNGSLKNKSHESMVKNGNIGISQQNNILNNIPRKHAIKYNSKENIQSAITRVKINLFYKIFRLALANNVKLKSHMKQVKKSNFNTVTKSYSFTVNAFRNKMKNKYFQIDATNTSLTNTLLKKFPKNANDKYVVSPSTVFDATQGVNETLANMNGVLDFVYINQRALSVADIDDLIGTNLSFLQNTILNNEMVWYQGHCDGLTTRFHYFFIKNNLLTEKTKNITTGLSSIKATSLELKNCVFIMIPTAKSVTFNDLKGVKEFVFDPIIITNLHLNYNKIIFSTPINKSRNNHAIHNNYIVCTNLSNIGVNTITNITSKRLKSMRQDAKKQAAVQAMFDFKRVLDRYHYVWASQFHKITGTPLYTLTHDYLSCAYGLTVYPYACFVAHGEFYIFHYPQSMSNNINFYKNKFLK